MTVSTAECSFLIAHTRTVLCLSSNLRNLTIDKMELKMFVIVALMCSVATSKATPLGSPYCEGVEECHREVLVDNFLSRLSELLAKLKLDNILLPNVPLTGLNGWLHDIHLRGLQKLVRSSPLKILSEGWGWWKASFEIDVKLMDYRFKSVSKFGGVQSKQRYYGTARNLKLRMVADSLVIPFVGFVIKELSIVNLPTISYTQFDDSPPSGMETKDIVAQLHSTTKDIVTEQLIPQAINAAFSHQNLENINQAMQLNMNNRNVVLSDSDHSDAFQHIYEHRKEMCDVYSLGASHNFTVSNADVDATVTLTNGRFRGLDFVNRVQCPRDPFINCGIRQCPNGEFVLKHDEAYLEYDGEVTVNGHTYKGPIYFRFSGLIEKEVYECEEGSGKIIENERSFVNSGELQVDLDSSEFNGVIQILKEPLYEFGIQARDAFLESMTNVSLDPKCATL